MEEQKMEIGPVVRRFGLPMLVVILIFGILLTTLNREQVFALTVNSEQIGYVGSQEEVQRIVNELVSAVEKEWGQEVKIAQEIKFTPAKGIKEQVVDSEQLHRLLSDKLSFLAIGYQLTVDGQEVVWVRSLEAAEGVQERIKALTQEQLESKGDVQVQSVTIREAIDGKTGFCPLEEIRSVDEAVEILLSGGIEQKKHIVQSGESLWSIANQHKLTVQELMEANPKQQKTTLQIGQELSLILPSPYITVQTTEKAVVKENIPFTIETVTDNNLWSGMTRVQRRGELGAKEITLLIKRENGESIDEVVIAQQVVREPVPQLVSRGSKSLPSRGTGQFLWPTQGRITSPFGYRWGRHHDGVDIAASTGTPIKAADSGIVVESGWRGGYGNVVIIDHGRGITTLYAHNSRNLVKQGDLVNKGQVIAHVGSTGQSTGPHLHFEIRINNRPVNPLQYFN